MINDKLKMIVNYKQVKIVDMIIDKMIFNRICSILLLFVYFLYFVIIEKMGIRRS